MQTSTKLPEKNSFVSGSLQLHASNSILQTGSKVLQAVNTLCYGIDKYAGAEPDKRIKPLFIVGLPRSGTTLVYELIVQAFEVNYFSHILDYAYGLPNITTRLTRRYTKNPPPRYQSRYGRIPGFFSPAENFYFWMRWFPESPVLGHHVPVELLDEETIADANRAVGSITQISGRPYVFKNLYSSLSISSLLKVFNNARIVIVQRELEAVAASMYKRRRELQNKRTWWSIKPPFSSSIQSNNLIEQVAFQCIRSEQLIEQAISEAKTGHCLAVNYKEVCESPLDFINRLAEWIGPEFIKREDSNLPHNFEQRPSVGFPEKDVERFNLHAEELRSSKYEYMESIARHVKQLKEKPQRVISKQAGITRKM
jgi:hypothetical protein